MNQRGFILPSPTMIMAGVIVALSLSNFLLYKLYRSEVNAYAQFQAEVAAQSEQLRVEAELARVAAERINKDVADGWAAALRVVTDHRPIRVSACGNQAGLRPVPATGLQANGAAVEPAFGTTVDASQCEALLNNAVVDAAKVVWLQTWITRQHEVRP